MNIKIIAGMNLSFEQKFHFLINLVCITDCKYFVCMNGCQYFECRADKVFCVYRAGCTYILNLLGNLLFSKFLDGESDYLPPIETRKLITFHVMIGF